MKMNVYTGYRDVRRCVKVVNPMQKHWWEDGVRVLHDACQLCSLYRDYRRGQGRENTRLHTTVTKSSGRASSEHLLARKWP